MSGVKGVDQVLRNLTKAAALLEEHAESALVELGVEIMGDSMDNAPVAIGNLRASAFVVASRITHDSGEGFKGKPAGKMSSEHTDAINAVRSGIRGTEVYVGHSAVYAAKVHQDPLAGQLGGQNKKDKAIRYATRGGWKFLERALKKWDGAMGARALAKSLKRRLATTRFPGVRGGKK